MGQEKKNKAVSSAAVARIVIWSIVLCVLSGIFAVAMTGGTSSWLFSLFSSDSLFYDAKGYEVGDGCVTATVRELSVDWVAGSVTVQAAEGDEVVISEDYGGDDQKLRLRWRVEDGELSVKFCSPTRFGKVDGTAKNVTISIPAAMLEALDEVEIDGADCSVSFTGNADELNLDVARGDIAVTGDIGTLDLDAAEGTVLFAGAVRKADMDCVRADVTMRLDMAAEVELDVVDGEILLSLSDEIAGFAAEMNALNGDIVTEGFDGVSRIHDRDVRWGSGGLRVCVDGTKAKLKIEKLTKD